MISLLTLTQPHWARLLEECVESAGAELQLIVQSASPEEYGRDRVRQIRMAETEYVAFLDDDDTLEPAALDYCRDAILQYPDAGVFVTNENLMSFDGSTKRPNVSQKTYLAAAFTPRNMHHLCVMRKSAIDLEGALALHEQFGRGIDWCLKASAAMTHGAVHVPRVLYNWRKNDGVSAANSRWWAQNMPAVSEQIIKRWSIRPGEVATARIDRK